MEKIMGEWLSREEVGSNVSRFSFRVDVSEYEVELVLLLHPWDWTTDEDGRPLLDLHEDWLDRVDDDEDGSELRIYRQDLTGICLAMDPKTYEATSSVLPTAEEVEEIKREVVLLAKRLNIEDGVQVARLLQADQATTSSRTYRESIDAMKLV